MKDEMILKLTVTPHFTLEIDIEDGNPPKVWRLCLDYRALAKLQAEIGLDLKKIETWKDISSKHFPMIVFYCLQRFNPEVTLEEVNNILNPACQRALSDILFDLCFPGAKEAWEKLLAEKDKGATADPNSPAVAKTA